MHYQTDLFDELCKLSKTERLVFDCLCQYMDEISNSIFFDNDLKETIVQDINLAMVDKKKVSVKSMPSIMQKLKGTRLILPSKDRGLYFINPEYFHWGSEKDRKKLIKKVNHERGI